MTRKSDRLNAVSCLERPKEKLALYLVSINLDLEVGPSRPCARGFARGNNEPPSKFVALGFSGKGQEESEGLGWAKVSHDKQFINLDGDQPAFGRDRSFGLCRAKVGNFVGLFKGERCAKSFYDQSNSSLEEHSR
jgi:hypothetical protein